MKFVKGVSLFFIYPVVMLVIGFIGGMTFMNYFYPGKYEARAIGESQDEVLQEWQKAAMDNVKVLEEELNGHTRTTAETEQIPSEEEAESIEAAIISEVITADTQYVLEETDMINQTVVETVSKIPAKYLGMNRTQFVESMMAYETSPPLSELERGFVSLEVLSFSTERVVVRMNYEYKQPSTSFYLLVEDNYVVVYLDDMQTIYMYTDIHLSKLPDEIQQNIINMLYMPDEESLYNFLEAYSS